MSGTFHEKLDFLMRLSGTKNSALGRALNFDASYISRIRTGTRGLPKHQPFLTPAAEYFARNLTEPYQRRWAADRINPGRPWPEDREEAAVLIATWLQAADLREESPVTGFLSGVSGLPSLSHSGLSRGRQAVDVSPGSAGERMYFYGNAGKREAVEEFLSELCQLGTPQTLLLHSDEDMTWLYEDPDFARRWSALLLRLLAQGGRIRIIHAIGRGLEDMLEAIVKWMPLYMIGTIEPYYCPRIRDGIYRRTLFIAKGHTALLSDSIGEGASGTVNIFIRDVRAVAALEEEFDRYFALCRPLMRIYPQGQGAEYFAALSGFEHRVGSMIRAGEAPSLATVPEEVTARLAERGGEWLLRRSRDSREAMERAFARGDPVTEILRLPPPEKVMAGGVCVPLSDLAGPPVFYTAEEFCAHLRAVLARLEEEGYRVVLSDEVPENIAIYAREDAGVMVAHTLPPGTVFHMEAPGMTAAFWEYLQRMSARFQREKAVAALRRYLAAFSEP